MAVPDPGGPRARDDGRLAGHRGRRGRPAVHPARRQGGHAPARWPSGSGSPAPRQQTRVGDLSGGERRRLQLPAAAAWPSPTCSSSTSRPTTSTSRRSTSLEDVLDGWAGTLLVVSHDRYLLERVVRPAGRAARRRRAARPARRRRAVPPAARRGRSGRRSSARSRPSGAAASSRSGAASAGRADALARPRSARPARRWRGSRGSSRGCPARGAAPRRDGSQATDHEVVLGLNGELRARRRRARDARDGVAERRRGRRLTRRDRAAVGAVHGRSVRRPAPARHRLERRQQPAQQRGERGLLALVEPGEQVALAGEQVGHGRVDDVAGRSG